jgi:uncharacterized repeat protein (TIGR01451 family)
VDVTIEVTTTAAGTLTNSASVNSDTIDPNPANNSASQETIVDPLEADLGLTKVDAVDPVIVGDAVTYTLSVINSGPDLAKNVVLTDTLPGTVTFASATPPCNLMGGDVVCNLGDITSGANVDVTIVVTTTEAGTLTNNASVSSDTFDPIPADNSTSETTEVLPACQNCLQVASITFGEPQINGNNFKVFASVAVVDELGNPVPEAVVDITWERPNGTTKPDSEAADGEGIASFNVNGGAGTFIITVEDISLAGYTFDPANSVVLTGEFTTP